MAAQTREPVTQEAERVWANRIRVEGLKRASQKFSRTAIFPSILCPPGVCIQEFATRIQRADRWDPRKRKRADHQYPLGETLLRPKRRTPRKTDSRKKAKTPSAARKGPKRFPTLREYSAQLVPKANSRVIPVAVPTTKSAPRSLTRKAFNSLYSSRRPLKERVSTIRITRLSPSVVGG